RDRAEKGVMEIGQVVGCLQGDSAGNWFLTNASQPTASETQATSSVALKAAQAQLLGSQQYQLIGVSMFNPSSDQGDKVAGKGILIKDSNHIRINVTSLQKIAANCIE